MDLVVLTKEQISAIAAEAATEAVTRLAPRLTAPQPAAGKLFWSEREAAAELHVTFGTLKRWRLKGYFSVISGDGKPVLYSREDLTAAASWRKRA